MNHLINSYGLFLAFFFSMFVLMMVVDYLSKKFDIGILRAFSGDQKDYCRYKESLFGTESLVPDTDKLERLEKRIAELELKARKSEN